MLSASGTKRILKSRQLAVASVNTAILSLIANGKLGQYNLVRATRDLGSIGVKIWVMPTRKNHQLMLAGNKGNIKLVIKE